ncbi:hypothetical protein [Apibacter sp. HY039]|uniref:hypothetical protein n=1 Tax=Apibacter sp. HY039 TaxID=2501476 RepID=UPI000FEBF9ED|nr:hypothetical protein [Apibacter sp. HY039]
MNCSNKDYHLFFSITCEKATDRPGFHIEFSNNYRDGSYGGIDFLSSNDDREVQLLVDGKSFQNPFKNYEETQFKKFTEALRNAKILTIQVYDHDDFTQELKLNRSIDFKLENGDLLDYPVQCNE